MDSDSKHRKYRMAPCTVRRRVRYLEQVADFDGALGTESTAEHPASLLDDVDVHGRLDADALVVDAAGEKSLLEGRITCEAATTHRGNSARSGRQGHDTHHA